MTALEELYKYYLEAKDKPIEEFYDTFRDYCPSDFFEDARALCEESKGEWSNLCCACWLQSVKGVKHETN